MARELFFALISVNRSPNCSATAFWIDSIVTLRACESIQKAVAEQFGLRLTENKAKNNSRAIVYPRQIAMYLAKHLTEASLPEIGRQFGGKHHTTVLHSVDKIDHARQS